MARALIAVLMVALLAPGVVAAVEPAALRTSFGDGMWRIRKDIRPGTYRTAGGRGCYWAILEDFRGGIVDSNVTLRKAPQVVTTVLRRGVRDDELRDVAARLPLGPRTSDIESARPVPRGTGLCSSRGPMAA
jgi:hypothetical protein